MTVYVALLHSIILGAGRRVVMTDLRDLATSAGYQNPRTLVATGNLVFEADDQPVRAVEAALEQAFAERFGKPVDIVVRDFDGWRRLAAGNPFPEGSGNEVVVRVMRHPLDPAIVDTLRLRMTAAERVAITGGDLWVDFAGKPSLSRLLSGLTTRHLGIGTLRNWNTVRGIGRMLDG